MLRKGLTIRIFAINKLSNKKLYAIQIIVILAVFSFVLLNLVFKLIGDIRSESLKKKVEQLEKERVKTEFIANIDDRYNQLIKLYTAGEYEKTIEIIKVFNKYGQSGHKNLPEIKKEIRLVYLKKKLNFLPKIHLNEYMQLSKDIEIKEDDTTEVFIRTPRYGQYFYTSDFPIVLEGIALSITGDFSDDIVWTSSIDGALGTGKKIAVRLSFGAHQITATGTNGVTTGNMVTLVYIENDPDFLKNYIRN